jgi:hypothetical protein
VIYPQVLGELETLRQVVAGRSIARYGDGELKMVANVVGIKSQAPDARLSERLGQILRAPGQCLVGIPNIHGVINSDLSTDQKVEFWTKHLRCAALLNPSVSYVSSFISRPDSAPWIDTVEYWALLESLWVGQDVTVVRGSGKSLAPEDLVGAGDVTDVLCRKQHAYQDYDEILSRIGTPKRALICLGPTATVLAYDLCRRGVHAIDLGHVAMFLRKRRRNEALSVTDEDRAIDREVCA